MCRDYALSQVDKQRDDFKRLGVSADWENPYITLTKDYEAAANPCLGATADKGYIYRGAKPVYWSWSSELPLLKQKSNTMTLIQYPFTMLTRSKMARGC